MDVSATDRPSFEGFLVHWRLYPCPFTA